MVIFERDNTLTSHDAYGLVVASDRPLPFGRAEAFDGEPDLVIAAANLGPVARPCFHRVEDYLGGPVLCVYGDGGGVDVVYDRWRFSWSFHQGRIAYEETEQEGRTDWPLVIERVVLPLYLLTTREDLLALHGSAVEIAGRAWIFLGDSGVGKSTTAYELLAGGGRLLADDMTLVTLGSGGGRPQVLGGCLAIRLWRGQGRVAEAVEDRSVHEYTTKRWFRLREDYAGPALTPLGGLIWLKPTGDPSLDGRFVRPGGQAGLADLLGQTFDFTTPDEARMRARFRNARRLFGAGPCIAYHYLRSSDGGPAHVEKLRVWLGDSSFDAAF